MNGNADEAAMGAVPGSTSVRPRILVVALDLCIVFSVARTLEDLNAPVSFWLAKLAHAVRLAR
jgi:hypothetical protein